MLQTARACQVTELHPLCAAPSTELSSLDIQGSQTEARLTVPVSFPHQQQPSSTSPPVNSGTAAFRPCPTCTLREISSPQDNTAESYHSYVFNIISTWCCAKRSSVTVGPPGWSRTGLPWSVGVSVVAAGGKEPWPQTEIIPLIHIGEPPLTTTTTLLCSN